MSLLCLFLHVIIEWDLYNRKPRQRDYEVERRRMAVPLSDCASDSHPLRNLVSVRGHAHYAHHALACSFTCLLFLPTGSEKHTGHQAKEGGAASIRPSQWRGRGPTVYG